LCRLKKALTLRNVEKYLPIGGSGTSQSYAAAGDVNVKVESGFSWLKTEFYSGLL
jgi:hypothetical protein